jgi:hypothetical protein
MNKGVLVVFLIVLVLAGVGLGVYWWRPDIFGLPPRQQTYTTEHTDYHPPQAEPQDVLVDDRLEDKKPVAFDPALVDRRPLGNKGEWRINASAAVVKLDIPLIRPDQEPDLLTLHSSYAKAVGPNPEARAVLPSVNLLDGKAKQFDDGLYAALDQVYYKGLQNKLLSHVEFVHRLYDKVGKDSVAAPFLAAGLELAGVQVEAANASEKARLLGEFRGDEVSSKPIGFYTWNDTLGSCFRFLRFFQRLFGADQLAVPQALARALESDKALLAEYRKALSFYAKLTNPYHHKTVADLIDDGASGKPAPPGRDAVAMFPASTSKEAVLFEDLFPSGLPPDADLMKELIRAIRSGKVDLTPKADSGWYEHQVYALETLLMPENGEERDKLLLTRAYKKRMLEAFQALITKRRETHVRQLYKAAAGAAAPPPLDKVRPRLRLEPNPSYYVRTARAYAFLANFLDATVGAESLQKLHGLKQGGERPKDLAAELHEMRDLFYGLYLVSAEDIGLKPSLAKGENVDPERCYRLASDWLSKVFQDEDLAADTRVGVPVFIDRVNGVVRIWLTLGVRLTKLEASYARPPRLKPTNGSADWQEVEAHRLASADYLIPVDEFAEVELPGLKVLTREELRAVCDREKTKEAIVKALRH